MIRRILLLAAVLLTVLGVVAPATAAAPIPRVGWVGTNPYGFEIGDSIVQQCGETFGMGWRSLGFIGWPGSTTADMRGRLDGTGSGWPDWTVTEDSVEMERIWFRDAGWLVIGLGTNDVKTMSAEQFAANVDWFMAQSRGRPVEWFTIHNPPFQAQVDAFNAVLTAKAAQYPNLLLLPWDSWADQHPGALLSDQVHVATSYGCDEGRDRLIQAGAPAVDATTAQPVGYWYPDPSTTGTVYLNGWGASRLPTADSPVVLNIRADWAHVGRVPVANPTGDLYAQAAAGHGFGVALGPEYRGHLICLDLLDAAGQWTPLGCRQL